MKSDGISVYIAIPSLIIAGDLAYLDLLCRFICVIW